MIHCNASNSVVSTLNVRSLSSHSYSVRKSLGWYGHSKVLFGLHQVTLCIICFLYCWGFVTSYL